MSIKEDRFAFNDDDVVFFEAGEWQTMTVAKHLPHQHDQQKHGTGGGPGDAAPKKTKRTKEQIASDDEKAWALHEQGKSWEQVASELGYANGGVARRSGLRHAERAKGGGAKTTDKTPDKPTPKADDGPDLPTPPRPEPSQPNLLEPTDNLEIAKATGQPYKPFTREGASDRIKAADADYAKAHDEFELAVDPARAAMKTIRDRDAENDRRFEERRKQIEAEKPHLSYSEVHALVEREGLRRRYFKNDDQALDEALAEGMITEAQRTLIRQRGAALGKARQRLQDEIDDDTLDHLAGIRTERTPPPPGSPDWMGPSVRYYDKKTGAEIDGWTITRADEYPRDGVLIAKETANYRKRAYEQQLQLHTVRTGRNRDGLTQEDIDDSLAYQQRVVNDPNTRVIVFAPANRVGAIAESGRFKTQADGLTHTGGYRDKEGTVRPGFEAAALGVHPMADPAKRPIYGVLATGGVRESGAFGAEAYGEVGFVLRRSVHSRTTHTSTDSLSICFAPSPLTGKQTTPNGPSGTGGVHKSKKNAANQQDTRFTTERRKSVGYHEAQVLGGVRLEDVEFAFAPKGKVSPAAIKKLRAAGVRVIEINSENLQTEKPSGRGKDRIIPDHFTSDGLWGVIPIPADKSRWTMTVDIFKHLSGKHDQAAHGGKRHGGYRLKDPDNPTAKPGQYREDSITAARDARAAAVAIEPQLTREMIDIADSVNGTLEGLDFRLKSEDSLARKIDAEKDTDFGGDAKKAAAGMSDIVRYTVTFDEGGYSGGVQTTLRELEAKGYKTRVKNYWSNGDPYQGINVALTHPSGVKIELQFHTPKSVQVKERVHLVLNEFRTAGGARTRYRLWDRMVRMAEQIPVPTGNLLGIGDVKTQTFTVKMRTLVKQMLEALDG